MTTFLDFRYARSLSGALFFSVEEEDVSIALEAGRDGYLAFDLPQSLDQRPLFELVSPEGAPVVSGVVEDDR
ncbi:MAG: hypothetical protein GY953_03130, partial [bacterium]|nr:hypothetical protein [bacterium]